MNVFSYVDQAGNTYDREVSSVNTNITSDHQGGNLAPRTPVAIPRVNDVNAKFAAARLPGGRHKVAPSP